MRLFLIIFFTPFVLFSQGFKLIKATVQTINHGASPSASENYIVLLKKSKNFDWSIDSVYSISDNKKVKYNCVSVINPEAVSPEYTALNSYDKKYKGYIQITFGLIKPRGDGNGRPNAPKINIDENNDFTKGIIVYTKIKRKNKILKIETFETLETVNAP